MRTVKQIEIEPVFCLGEIPNKPSAYEEGKIYVSAKMDKIGFNCLCGCGDLTILDVNKHLNGWHLEVDEQKRITLKGSVLQYNCGSHYVISKNKVNFM